MKQEAEAAIRHKDWNDATKKEQAFIFTRPTTALSDGRPKQWRTVAIIAETPEQAISELHRDADTLPYQWDMMQYRTNPRGWETLGFVSTDGNLV